MELPVGWIRCALPNFTYLEMGQSPPSETYNHEKVGLPFFQGKAEFTSLYPAIDKYCSEPTKIARSGATLLSVRAPVGPTNLANIDCCIGRGLAGIHPLGGIEPKFILFLMRSIENEISDKGTGSTFTAINKTFLEQLVFALPPL
jgi:type I restriction enzyme S subunit